MRRLTSFLHRAADTRSNGIRHGSRLASQEQALSWHVQVVDQRSGTLLQQLQLSRQIQPCSSGLQWRSCQYNAVADTSLSGTHSHQNRPHQAFKAACHFSASAKDPWEAQSVAKWTQGSISMPHQQPVSHGSHRLSVPAMRWRHTRTALHSRLSKTAIVPQRRHFSAPPKGPWEGQASAERPRRPASQPVHQPASHGDHRQPGPQLPLQQPAGHGNDRQPGPRMPHQQPAIHGSPGPQISWQNPRAHLQSRPLGAGAPQQSRPETAFAPGSQRPGQNLQRPQQDSLSDLTAAGPTKYPFEGLKVEGDADVRLVSEDRTHKVMTLSAAMKLAKRERMDLLPVAPHAKPPVFRLGDANEAAKQARLRERDMRKKEMENRRKTLMKEVKIGPNTQENDLKMKLDKAREMIDKKYRVRLFIPYRNQHREAAKHMLQRVRELCSGFANVAGPEGNERLPTNTVVVYLSPKV